MKDITIIHASMTHSPEDGYVGKVQFRAEGHRDAYEIALQSKRGKEWSYGLFFVDTSGREEEIFQMEERLEEDDELFDWLTETAMNAKSS
ncbi:hypothetical protein PA598K_02521 [Paenibacillus sp. 598K]|uniref:hypothetical protein n=1 Tax=Paenibacillus sp. 598K TaxID=1117987 RepID=UPI000FFA9462|nr:hypothetical protein [Paenibacillus sp. 598K]GBF74189.1 hypothetical protein PA598K_02521 [Paenibacillus sp. 598K]